MRTGLCTTLVVMRAIAALGVVLVLCTASVAQPPPAASGPLRVAVECESYGRTKACPAFLLGFLDANKVLLSAPRSDADVVLYVSATEVALADRVHLRFVGNVPGAPKVIETDVDVDTRGDDDAQRGELEPAFLRGVALFVAARHPDAVTVALAAPEAGEVAAPKTSPYDVGLSIGGFGSAFGNPFADDSYLNFSGYVSLFGSRVTRKWRVATNVDASGGVSLSPPLVLDDGTTVSLDTKQWGLSAAATGAWLYNDCYSFGGSVRAFREDPKGQFKDGLTVKAGVEWDKYPSDDPRGNRLAVLYYGGYQVERYNIRNEIGERFAQFPIHGLVASGSLRKDKVGVGVSLSVGGEVLHPGRRHHLSASPYVEWQIGTHVDVSVSFSITKREFPAPDESMIDPGDFELQQRLSYAQPLSMNGSLSLSIHWDRTNGERNNRFGDI
jgi:hypothetical protein